MSEGVCLFLLSMHPGSMCVSLMARMALNCLEYTSQLVDPLVHHFSFHSNLSAPSIQFKSEVLHDTVWIAAELLDIVYPIYHRGINTFIEFLKLLTSRSCTNFCTV